MSIEAHHRFILDTMQRNQDIARNIINDLEAENARLKAEVGRHKFTLEEERQIARQDWAGLRCEHDRVKRALEQAESEVERLEPELEQRCRELNLSIAQQAIQLRQIGELKAEVERLEAQRTQLIESAVKLFRFIGQELYGPIDHFEADWEAAKEGKPSV